MNDRRIQRSRVPTVAARLLLQAASRRGGHVALALVDHDGLLIADDDSALDLEAVAAITPLATNNSAPDGLLGLVTRGEQLHVWDFELEGASYYLAAVGGTSSCPSGTAEGLRRIFR